MGSTGRIDVHHHFNAPGGRGGQPHWTPQRAVDEMDGAGVAVAIGWPGPVLADDVASARRRARAINEFGATIVQAHSTRFGLFASLPPLSDVDGALHELAYGLDTLGADGIGLTTHCRGANGGDAWLGDPSFKPIFAELDRRAAVVFVHPQGHLGACACGAQSYQTPPISAPWLEYPFNTARAILNLMAAGTFRACPNIKFIFCHGGGAFTSLIGRISGFSGWHEIGAEKLNELFPDGVEAEFKRLFFECAQAYAPQNMALLRSLVPDSQILFGTDYDRFSMGHGVEQFMRLELAPDVRTAIESGNAHRLLPRLRR